MCPQVEDQPMNPNDTVQASEEVGVEGDTTATMRAIGSGSWVLCFVQGVRSVPGVQNTSLPRRSGCGWSCKWTEVERMCSQLWHAPGGRRRARAKQGGTVQFLDHSSHLALKGMSSLSYFAIPMTYRMNLYHVVPRRFQRPRQALMDASTWRPVFHSHLVVHL